MATLCSALSAPGQTFALSLYIEHLISDLGISRVEISSAYALATLAAAATLPLFGAWADRTSARRFMGTILIGIALALTLLSQAMGLGLVVVAVFALRMLGQGAIGLGTITATVRWFKRYRGRALAIVTLGYALGELVFPAVIVTLSALFGWRGSLLVLAAIYTFFAAPFVIALMRERRAHDQPVDGTPADVETGRRARAALREDPDFNFMAGVRTPTFWAMLIAVSVSPMVLTAVIFHQVALFAAHGWATTLIPTAFAAYALASVACTYMAGVALERWPVRLGVSASLVLTAVGLAWYQWGGDGGGHAIAYGAVLGASAGIAAASNSLVWPEYYGVRALGALKGVVNAVRNGATAAGPVLAALAFQTGGIELGLLVLGIVALAGAVLALFVRPPADRRPAAGRQDLASAA